MDPMGYTTLIYFFIRKRFDAPVDLKAIYQRDDLVEMAVSVGFSEGESCRRQNFPRGARSRRSSVTERMAICCDGRH